MAEDDGGDGGKGGGRDGDGGECGFHCIGTLIGVYVFAVCLNVYVNKSRNGSQ